MAKIRTGNIAQRGKSSFRLRWYDDKGERIYETVKGVRSDAEAILKQRLDGIPKPSVPAEPPKSFVRKRLHSVGYEIPGVYFLLSRANGLVKIGHARDAGKRLGALVSQSSVTLTVVAFIPCFDHLFAERTIHKFLDAKRSHGEWFRIGAIDIEAAIRYWALTATGAKEPFVPSAFMLEAA